MYCWGNSVNGELGLGGIEEEKILSPRHLPVKFDDVDVKSVACGDNHTIFLLDDGSVYSCGSNDFGQLGHTKARRKLEALDSLKALANIKQVACGSHHTLALSDWGGIYSWGHNSHSQLGHSLDKESCGVPRLVKNLAAKQAVQIAGGANHSLALLSNGELYAWGDNDRGQLGLGSRGEPVREPTLVAALQGVPVASLACGGAHCFVVSRLGGVFGWGANEHGQLGQNDRVDRLAPTPLEALRSQHVRYVTCGDNFTACLTRDGGVFTFGAGSYGQLGHGSASNEIVPRQVLELMGSPITQIASGRCHTLVQESKRNLVQCFGQGGSGQLGLGSVRNSLGPSSVQAAWTNGDRRKGSPPNDHIIHSPRPLRLKRIFCGGDQSFALLLKNNKDTPDDFRVPPSADQIPDMNLDSVSKFADLDVNDETPVELSIYVETVFGSPACISASFVPADRGPCTELDVCLDVAATKRFFAAVAKLRKSSVLELIQQTMRLVLFRQLTTTPLDLEALRCYVVISFSHFFEEPSCRDVLCSVLASAVLQLDEAHRRVLRNWWAGLPLDDFARIVRLFRDSIGRALMAHNPPLTPTHVRQMVVLTRMLGQLFAANQSAGQPVQYDAFYVAAINERVDIFREYRAWQQWHSGVSSPLDPTSAAAAGPPWSLLECPFMFDAEAKTTILRADAVMRMQHAMDETNQRNFVSMFLVPGLVKNPYLVLPVTRDNLVQDTLDCLSKIRSDDFKKPLKVVFVGEEAVDGGGVRKEFFMLLIKELIDPKYGMFKVHTDTGCIWFNEKSFETEQMFYIIGLVCGLAIYNGNIIALPFPLALYKKLLDERVELDDLAGLSSGLHRGLVHMLEHDGDEDDFEDTFAATFEVSLEAFGQVHTYELRPGGATQRVTRENRKQYVDEYVDFLLNGVVSRQYGAFHNGFYNVLRTTVVTMFHARELMAMVVGNENYEWDVFEANAEYREGLSRDHRTVRAFWRVFRGFTLEQKKRFLLFLTGYDRIPIFGMKIVKIVIQPMRCSEEHLPVAHTCFNLLDLPLYSSEDKLRRKLLLAIEHSRGFALA